MFLQGKKYSVYESENNSIFYLENGDILENEHFLELLSTDEFVLGMTAGKDSFLIKTCQDLSDDKQKINMYYVDIKTDRIMVCNDTILNESYHMPYISICDEKEYILAESAVIYPYEIEEASKNTSFTYKNDIVMVSLQELEEMISRNEELRWNALFSAKEGYYINILQVYGPYVWFSEITVDETKSNIRKYNLSSGLIETNLCVENRIDRVIFDEDRLLCMYKWNSGKEIIDIYNSQGQIIVRLDYSALINENDEIELDEILTILDERYIVFSATDYSKDESYSCRIVYDTANKTLIPISK